MIDTVRIDMCGTKEEKRKKKIELPLSTYQLYDFQSRPAGVRNVS